MTALTENRKNSVDEGRYFDDDCAAAVHVFQGALVSLDSSGNARPARATATDTVRGIAEKEVDNSTGAAGDLKVRARQRVGFFVNSAGGDEITKADFGSACFVVDDQTVAKTSSSGTRPPAGIILGLEGGLVRVAVGYAGAYNGDLLSTANLSDVASAATSRANIGANVAYVNLRVPLDADDTYRIPLPDGGTVSELRSVVEASALTGGAPTITTQLDGTPITGGVLTLSATAAEGEKDTATPSAANVAAADNSLEFVVAANSQSNAAFARITAKIEY